MEELFKLKAWLWITAGDKDFQHPFSCWHNNTMACLGITSD